MGAKAVAKSLTPQVPPGGSSTWADFLKRRAKRTQDNASGDHCHGNIISSSPMAPPDPQVPLVAATPASRTSSASSSGLVRTAPADTMGMETVTTKAPGEVGMKSKVNKKTVKERAPGSIIKNKVRGSMDKAMKAASSDLEKRMALEALENEMFTKGTRTQQRAAWNTWCKFHRAWFGHRRMLPLTPGKILGVGAMFHAGSYRSFPNYLSAARQLHIQRGFPITDRLKQTAARVERAVARGQGPGVQAKPFPIEKVAKL